MLVFLMLVFSFALMLERLPVEPVKLTTNYLDGSGEAMGYGQLSMVDYGSVEVFAENLRFSHNLISYWISSDCDAGRRGDMVEALTIFSDEMKVVSFFEVDDDADILIGCSNDFVELGEDLFAAGEGGPSRIINTSGFKIIEEGKIKLYAMGGNCDYPIVALHELFHVFGFGHSPDPMNIMYNTSACDQRMSDDMVDLIVALYSVEALSDARIESVTGAIKGRYLDFNISILNEGLIGIDGISLTILGDGEVVDMVDLGEIAMGYGRNLRVVNMDVGSGVEEVRFVLDAEGLVRELDEGNNAVEMTA